MKTKTTILQLLIILLISLPTYLFSQQEGKNGIYVPVHDTIRVLIIYAEADYSTDPSATEDPLFIPNKWPVDTAGKTLPPINADSLFDHQVPMNGVLEGIITKKFSEASLGNYIILGDFFPEVITVPHQDIADFVNPGSAIFNILNTKQPLSDTLRTFNNVPVTDFDLYSLNNNPGLIKSKVSDGIIDVLMFVWRNNDRIGASTARCNAGYGLVPLNPGDTIKGMSGIGASTIANFNGCGTDARDAIGIIMGEYFHGMFGVNNWHTGGGAGTNTFIAVPASYSLTGQESSTMRSVSGFDRWFLDWKVPSNLFQTSTRSASGAGEISSDLSIQNQGTDTIFRLRDFTTFGDAIRIELPHLQNTSALPQYLWLENRRMNTRFDEYYNTGCADSNIYGRGTPGIYAYLQVGREFKSGSNIYSGPLSAPLHKNYLFPLSAEGNFDFVYRTDKIQAANLSIPCNFGNENIPIEKSTSLINSFTGNSDLYNAFDADSNGIQDDLSPLLGLSEVIGASVVHNANRFGDWEDAFATGTGNTKISMGTNPSTSPVYTGKGAGFVQPYHNQTIYLNGLSISIDDQTHPEDVLITVKWNDYDVNNDTRWCGNIVLQNDSNNPSMDTSRINLKSGNTILLDQGKAATLFEGTLQADNTFLFANPTLLTLKSGTVTIIEDGSELLVQNGSSLHIQSGAKVIVKGTGKITVDSSAYICVEPGAIIILQDAQSELFVDNNASTGLNPLLNISTASCSNLCDIETLNITPTSNGFMTHKSLADAGLDQTICPAIGANVLGGNPTALTSIGTPGFTYSWIPTTGLDDPTIANPTITGTITNNTFYAVTVTDTNGCTGSDAVLLFFNPAATNTISSTDAFCVGVGTDDGTATVTVGCGNPLAYTYLWSDSLAQTTATATGLAPGNYSVFVTAPNGDTTTNFVTVNQATNPLLYDFINPVITTDTTWSSDLKIKGEVKVKPGGILRIVDARIEFSYDTIIDFNLPYNRARIVIEVGGEVEAKGAILTGCGGGIWDGIEVWGDTSAAQVTTDQGVLFISRSFKTVSGTPVLTNSAIENAITGIQVFRSDLDNVFLPPSFGGKVTASFTDFKNNRRAVYFRDYPQSSFSTLNQNEFTYNDSSLFSYNFPFEEMEFIRLDNMQFSGSIVTGNQFMSSTTFAPQERGTAVKINNSAVVVSGNDFFNLKSGVDAATVNSVTVLDIKNNNFNDCVRGAYVKGYAASIIQKNTFNVPAIVTDTTYGLYMQETTLYAIEENTFNGGLNQTVGMYIHNTDPLNDSTTNEVYKNEFNDLGFASFGNGENSKFGDATKGLTFKCNTYNNSNFDIITTVAPGISTEQGQNSPNHKRLAGNEFVTGCFSIDGELLNTANTGTQTNSYQYHHHLGTSYIPDAINNCFTPLQVDPQNQNIPFDTSATVGSCVSQISSGLPLKFYRDSLKAIINDNLDSIKVIEATLDGGITNQLIPIIEQQSQPDNQLKNFLENNAPLSSEVLSNVATSNYSSKTISKILVSASPLSDNVLLDLLNRTSPLNSKDLKKILLQNVPAHWQIVDLVTTDVLSTKDMDKVLDKHAQKIANSDFLVLSLTQLIESEISGLEKENNLLQNTRIRSFLRDSTLLVPVRVDSVIAIIDSSKIGIVGKSLSIEALCKAKKYPDAIQIITELEQQGIALEYCSMQRALIDMAGMPDGIMSIKTDPALKSKVEAVAANPTLTGNINARNLLEMAFKKKVKEIIDFPIPTLSNRFGSEEPSNNKDQSLSNNQLLETGYRLINYPNPFNENTTIEAVLPINSSNAYLVIHDLTGREMYRTNLKGGMNKKTIDSSILPKGIYIYYIEMEGRVELTSKLVKMK
jgi:Secretion system C-terminal sorting domain